MTTITVEAPADFLVANGGHGNRYAKADRVKQWRAKAAWAARAAKLEPVEGFVRVTAFVNRGHNMARYDPANWYETAKACVDGLVDAGILEDDSHRHIDGPDMRPGLVIPKRPSLVLTISSSTPERQTP